MMRPRINRSSARPNYELLDLFSGCGGLTEGFVSVKERESRFIPVAAVELDGDAAATYAANFGAHIHQGDIQHWLALGVPKVDVVIGGPPCQGFSWLGKRQADDPRNKLWRFYAEAVAAAQPAYFVIENVVPFLRSDQFQELRDETEPGGTLEGYTLDDSPGAVRAIDFGAAQDRRRALVVGRRKDLPAIDLGPWMCEPLTVWDAIGHLPRTIERTDLPSRTESVPVSNGTLHVPGVFTTGELHVTRRYTPLSRERISHIPPGGNRHDIPHHLRPDCWKNHDTGHADTMGRLHWNRPSVTIRTEFWKPEKGRYLHPSADRALTHAEAAALQGFPDDFRWCGSKVSVGRQIGNAVPVPLGQAVARAILTALQHAGVSPRHRS